MTVPVPDGPLFKILSRGAWEARGTTLPRAPVDEADGFVHLSAANQVRETAHKHFAEATDLVLVRLEGPLPGLRWEPSRGGALFPHVYGDVSLVAVTGVTDLVGENAGHLRVARGRGLTGTRTGLPVWRAASVTRTDGARASPAELREMGQVPLSVPGVEGADLEGALLVAHPVHERIVALSPVGKAVRLLADAHPAAPARELEAHERGALRVGAQGLV